MKILMVASESNPFAKSGGLADVIYSLSKEMVKIGNEVSIVMPLYKRIKEKYKTELVFLEYQYINIWSRREYMGILKMVRDGINYYFIDNDDYFYRDNLYEYDDDIRRFAYFDMAVCSMIRLLNLKFDVVHVHDHQAGMVPLLLKYYYEYPVKTVLTIHNPAFQGIFDPYRLGELFNMDRRFFDDGTIRFNDQCSFLKAAIMTVDKITTVSPNHRDELYNGMYDYGLHNVLRYRDKDFVGIVNGVDYEEFNPSTDKGIYQNYDISNIKLKLKNKSAFCKEYGFNEKLPLYGLVSRLTNQKGIELLLDRLPYYMDKINVFILGSGETKLEEQVKEYSMRYSNFKSFIGYSDALAHKVYASSDFFFMPSFYEPCGIGQMIAHRYGTIPIVRETGGLKDTVSDLEDGIIFKVFDSLGMDYGIKKSLEIYGDKRKMNPMIKKSINKDHSWVKSTKEYLDLYKEI